MEFSVNGSEEVSHGSQPGSFQVREFHAGFFKDVEADAGRGLEAVENDVHQFLGLAGGTEMSYQKSKFGCPLGCESVRITESTKESRAKDNTLGSAAGVSRALKYQGNHRGLNCVDLGRCQAADGEGITDTFLEYAGVVQPCGVGIAGTEGQDPA